MLDGENITPVIAMTDADTLEHNALDAVWKGIWLLTCVFHVWKSWRRSYRKRIGTGLSAEMKRTRNEVRSPISAIQKKISVHGVEARGTGMGR